MDWLQKALNGGINALSFVCTPERSWEAVSANQEMMQFYGDQVRIHIALCAEPGVRFT